MIINVFDSLSRYIKKYFIRNKEPYLSLYRLLGFYPNNPGLYQQALTHRSSSTGPNGRCEHNERLEFLGDAVLNAIVADMVYKSFPNRKEGFMTNTRSKIVKRESLNHISLAIGLDKMIVSSARINPHNNYIYGNAFEALIGAIYLDQGYRKCCRFVQRNIIAKYLPLDKIVYQEVNFKSNLLEWSQKNRLEIVFNLIDTQTGKGGHPMFLSNVSLGDRQLGIGKGFTKKESQQLASKMAIRNITKDRDTQKFIRELKARNGDRHEELSLNDLPETDSATA